jgi:hypothetical protein
MLGTSANFPGKTMAGSTCNGIAHTNRHTEAVTLSIAVRPGLVQALLQHALSVRARL